MRWQLVEEQDKTGQSALFADEELAERHVGTGEFRGLEFLHVRSKTILNHVPGASRMPFEWTINAYRGCSHRCDFCFARPTHAYLDLDIDRDFETKIVVKVNAVERLRAELAHPRWKGDHIAIGTNTDPYQRCEGKYHLYRGMLGVLTEKANPFSILTKSTLILRDTELLQAASEVTDVRVNFSIGTLDEAVWKATESGAPHPRRRVEAVRRLTDAGITTGVLIAPVLPGMSDRDDQLDEVVTACIEAGAVSVAPIPLHLRPGVREVFMSRLPDHRPDLVEEYERLYGRRSYLPKSYTEDLTARVRKFAAAARGRGRVIGASRSVTRRMAKSGMGPGRRPTLEAATLTAPPPTLF